MSCVTYEKAPCPNPLGEQNPPIRILLTLSGGGALGAFEVGVLEHLHNNLDVGKQVRAVNGVSFGGINAALYVANIDDDPIGAMKEFYNAVTFADSPLLPHINPWKNTAYENFLVDLSPPAMMLAPFYNANFYKARTDLWNLFLWTHFYDNSRLLPLLKKLIDIDKINSPESPQLILTAVDIKSGSITAFNNRRQTISYENILASASLPPLFNSTNINGQEFWDGGLFDNTPLLTLLNGLEFADIHEGGNPECDPTQKRIITIELFPRTGNAPENIIETFNRILQIIIRVKISQQARDYIYEAGVLANWLYRFFKQIESPSQPVTELLQLFGVNPSHFQAIVAQAAAVAVNDYMEEGRPDPRVGYRAGPPDVDCSSVMSAATVERQFELNYKGLSGDALSEIQEFAQLGDLQTDIQNLARSGQIGGAGGALGGQNAVSELILQLRESQLITDTVTLFTNIELLPIQATIDPGLFGIGDYSASAIKNVYAAGLQAAKDQVKVVEFLRDVKDQSGNVLRDRNQNPLQERKRDLQFTPITLAV